MVKNTCFAVLAVATVCIVYADADQRFRNLYDYYFPKDSPFVTTRYRNAFDRTVFKSGPRPEMMKQREHVYDAVRGDAAAVHAFVHSIYREAAGEFGATWMRECTLLLIYLGDEEFARRMAKEDKKTKELVGAALNSQIEWKKHPFPKTRAVIWGE